VGSYSQWIANCLINKAFRPSSVFKPESPVMEREKIETTGIGSGVALPHARIKGLKRSRFAFGIAPKGIDFKSLGGKPVTSIFLILFPEKEANTQLYVLARLSRFLNNKNFLKKLSACKTGQQVIDDFTQYEKDDFS